MWVDRRQDVRQGRLGRHRSTTTARSTRSRTSQAVVGHREVHPAAWDPSERLRLMDERGIHAQVLYPNAVGIGGQNLANAVDGPRRCGGCASRSTTTPWPRCRRSRATGFLPMPVMPAWDIDALRARGRSAAPRLGLPRRQHDRPTRRTPARPTSPTAAGTRSGRCAPTSTCRCTSTSGRATRASTSTATTSGRVAGRVRQARHRRRDAVPQQRPRRDQQRLRRDLRPPPRRCKMVSVESGIGWVPFILETMDYELVENAPDAGRRS